MDKKKQTKSQLRNGKRSRNDADYARNKDRHDLVLLRLEKGGAALLDGAARAVGLSRASFTRQYLPPLMKALADQSDRIGLALSERSETLEMIFSQALGEFLQGSQRHQATRAPESGAESVGDDFDEIFLSPGEP